jgi:TolB protein
MRAHTLLCLLAAACAVSTQQARAQEKAPAYRLSFASFGPLDTDIFIADAEGRNAHPFLPSP